MSKINQIIEIVSKIIKVDKELIDEKSSMKNLLKWDSLAHLNIMMEIEKRFKKKISTSKMGDLDTIKKIYDFLKS
jgi:acyl carrier protein